MTSRVLVVGFNACEVTLVEREVAAGRLPNFARLRDRSLGFHLGNPMETLPGAIWPEINTGVSSGTMGDFYIPGEPVVARVFTAEEQYGPARNPDLPDVICVFRTDLGMIERCVSPSFSGEVHVPAHHPHAPRTGDHTPHSRLWVSGPSIHPAQVGGPANVVDIAPTVLAALGVGLPDGLDGRPLVVLQSAADKTTRRVLADAAN